MFRFLKISLLLFVFVSPTAFCQEQINHKELVQKIMKIIDSGEGINSQNEDGQTPLFLACQIGEVPLVRHILDAGGQLGITTNMGFAPLHAAASKGHVEVASILLKHGVSADVQNPLNGFTPLYVAASAGQLQFCELLIAYGADVNLLSYYHRSPLMYAITNGYIQVAELLLEKGAAIEDYNNSGQTPLLLAAQKMRPKIVKLLLEKGANASAISANGYTVFVYASSNSDIEMLKLLVELDVDINMVDGDGYTCFYRNIIVSYPGDWDLLEVLIKLGANPNIPAIVNMDSPLWLVKRTKDKHGQKILENLGVVDDPWKPALHRAAKRSSGEASLQALIDNGADVNAVDFLGNTPLHYAFFGNCSEAMDILIANKASINAVNKYGMTPLHYLFHARVRGSQIPQRIQSMLAIGADPTIQNFNGETVLHFACKELGRSPEVLQYIIHKGGDINQPNKMGFYPLHLAGKKQNLVSILIEGGADLEVRTRNGVTPLSHSISKRRKNVTDILLKAGANVNTVSYMGWTPLHYAAWNGATDTIKDLVSRGGDLSSVTLDGKSVLDIAEEKGKAETYTFIKNYLAALNSNGSDGEAISEPDVDEMAVRQVANAKKLEQKQTNDERVRGIRMYHCHEHPLAMGVLQSDPNAVMKAVENGADPNEYFKTNYSDSSYCTSMYMATRFQDEKMIRLLVNLGADINLGKKKPLSSPLHLAAEEGYLEITKLLLELGANMKGMNSDADTPFVRAALKCDRNLVNFYEDKGFDINVKDKSGRSLLHRAVCWSSTISYLLKKGLDPNAKDNSGLTVLHSYVLSAGTDLKVPKLLVEYGADVNAADKYGNTPLCGALQYDKLETAKFLIEKGADVNAGTYGSRKNGPIHLAKGNIDIVVLLVNHGADVHVLNQKQQNVIHSLANSSSGGTDDAATLDFFLKSGVDINAKDIDQKTPVFYCIDKGRIDLLEILIEKGANIQTADKRGQTPLWYAAVKKKNKAMVQILLQSGAKTEIQGEYGKRLRESLQKSKQFDILEMIEGK